MGYVFEQKMCYCQVFAISWPRPMNPYRDPSQGFYAVGWHYQSRHQVMQERPHLSVDQLIGALEY